MNLKKPRDLHTVVLNPGAKSERAGECRDSPLQRAGSHRIRGMRDSSDLVQPAGRCVLEFAAGAHGVLQWLHGYIDYITLLLCVTSNIWYVVRVNIRVHKWSPHGHAFDYNDSIGDKITDSSIAFPIKPVCELRLMRKKPSAVDRSAPDCDFSSQLRPCRAARWSSRTCCAQANEDPLKVR